jgi:hypothetical protein
MRRLPTSPRLQVVVFLALMVIVGAGLGAWYGTRGSGGNSSGVTAASSQASLPVLSHRQYALLYLGAVLKKTKIGVLNQWPKPPYQHYHSGNEDCYEWWDKPVALYNLCFVNGILTDKAIE